MTSQSPASADLVVDVSPEVAALEFVEITKIFPGVRALDEVSLKVNSGEVHALVGENGAGKSTLMAVASGEMAPDHGAVHIGGAPVTDLDPVTARESGIFVVHQEPALIPLLTVAENMRLATHPARRPSWRDNQRWCAGILRAWLPSDGRVVPNSLIADLTPEERCLVEIARAFASEPRVLILDEPTEHLDAESTARLFAAVERLVRAGGSVIYISHRIGEVRQIADRVSILRDGHCEGTFVAEDLTAAQIVKLVVGRDVQTQTAREAAASRQPLGLDPSGRGGETPPRVKVEHLSNGQLSDVSLSAHVGEIVGLAGIEGQGQRDVLAALAGLASVKGSVSVDGKAVSLSSPRTAASSGIRLVPNDRRSDGILSGLSVRENLTISSLPKRRLGVVLDRAAERRVASRVIEALRIKTPDAEVEVDYLSGGNQQKVVLGRLMLAEPKVMLADEPSQGVDVGARQDLYRLLREMSEGAAILIASTDNDELVQLCDRVLVFSRGQIVTELVADEITAHAITEATLGAGSSRARVDRRAESWRQRLHRRIPIPIASLLVTITAMTICAQAVNDRFLSELSVRGLLTLFAAIAFVAIGQQVVMLVGGIDLSVGPLTGWLLVVGSFLIERDTSGLRLVAGLLVLGLATLAIGALNAMLTIKVGLQPVVATLVTFIGLQGFSLLLRPSVGGSISAQLIDVTRAQIGPVPIPAIIAVALAALMHLSMKRTMIGLSARAVGSAEPVARRLGVNVNRVRVSAYLTCSAFVLLGALMLMAQVGIGDPSAGVNYTLVSITAVVLGGASMFGGSASFFGAVLGALLIQVVNSAVPFLRLSEAWQYYLLGALTLIAAGLYSRSRVTA